jgi:hypothetical protein
MSLNLRESLSGFEVIVSGRKKTSITEIMVMLAAKNIGIE